MSEKVNNQIVTPADSCRDNRHTPLGVALKISSQRNGQYKINKTEEKHGFFFEFEGIKVPFRALIQDNNKVHGIPSISFGTAKECPSKALGLCQLPEGAKCYAENGEARATKRDNQTGTKGMDSYYKGLLFSAFWDEFQANGKLRLAFIDWCESRGFETFRVNLKGDFRTFEDVATIYYLANSGFEFAVYTARDDLGEFLETLADHPRVIVNGSNRCYSNRFKATTSIEEYIKAEFPCLGDCPNCRKCYSLENAEITCLIHGAGSDTLLNNPENREFIKNVALGGLYWFRDTDFEASKGFMTCINKELAKIGLLWRPKTIKDLIKGIKEMGDY